MKFLFLDIDGVLNSTQHYYRLERRKGWTWKKMRLGDFLYRILTPLCPTKKLKDLVYHVVRVHFMPESTFCPVACSNLRVLMKAMPELKIVISSTWRLSGLSFCKRVLKKNGIDVSRIVGATPVRGQDKFGFQMPFENRIRGYQIQAWLNGKQKLDGEAFDDQNFVIVDDDSDMEHLSHRLVKTSSDHGLLFQDVVKIVDMLGGDRRAI